MKYIVIVLIIFTSASCKDEDKRDREKDKNENTNSKEIVEKEPIKNHIFSSKEWGVSFEYPNNSEVYEGELAPNSPVINI